MERRILKVGNKYKVQRKILFFWLDYMEDYLMPLLFNTEVEAHYFIRDFYPKNDKSKPEIIAEYDDDGRK